MFSSNVDDGQVLIASRLTLRTGVREILTTASEPLHVMQVAQLLSERYGLEVEEPSIRALMSEVGRLVAPGMLVARGRHSLGDDDFVKEIGKAAESIVTAGAVKRQWHAYEIAKELTETGFLEPGVDSRLVNAALLEGSDLVYLGGQVWASRASGLSERIAIKDMVAKVLRKSSRPMTAKEIRQKIEAVRGMAKHFQIHESESVIRVGHGLWGLRGRDSKQRLRGKMAKKRKVL